MCLQWCIMHQEAFLITPWLRSIGFFYSEPISCCVIGTVAATKHTACASDTTLIVAPRPQSTDNVTARAWVSLVSAPKEGALRRGAVLAVSPVWKIVLKQNRGSVCSGGLGLPARREDTVSTHGTADQLLSRACQLCLPGGEARSVAMSLETSIGRS